MPTGYGSAFKSMTDISESAYASQRARVEFWLFCAATFLAFLTTSTISYLSVILSSAGMGERTIGFVLSSAALPVVFGILWSGRLVQRYGALNVAICGQILSLIAFGGFQFSVTSPLWVGSCRVLLGLGFGMFFPAAMVFAKSKLNGPRTTYLFGIYASMVPLPNILGPALAERYFASFGTAYLFVALAAPLGLGILMMFGLTATSTGQRNNGGPEQGYWYLLRMPSLFLPNATIFVVGMTWGFVVSFMALFLHQRHVDTALFFSSCTSALIASRFLLLGSLVRVPRQITVATGLFLMATSYAVIVEQVSPGFATIIGGVIFGIGYSLAFPILSVWISGIFSLPVMVGALSQALSLDQILLCLAILAGAWALWLVMHYCLHRWWERQSSPSTPAP
jgi:hypothetical protein